ncbi:MAG: formylglycine-generating enzyme family protein [Chloroflexi bacterium]|nr:formylglycine-generating enzyme family protein [Chloroflexota bacterium]
MTKKTVMAVILCIVLGSLTGCGATKEPMPVPTESSTRTPIPTQTPTQEPVSFTLGTRQTRSVDNMVTVYVPGGTFQMGSDESDSGAYDDEFPQHAVTLDAFWIDQTEVTNAQFAAFLNDQGNQTEGEVTWLELESEYCPIEQVGDKYQPKSNYADHPVIEVSWYGANAYCQWVGMQLPTEAQWEYAARGMEGHIYPWGDSPPTCNLTQFEGCSGDTVPVGGLPDGASWCDALDMAGNVWEWVVDWHGDYFSGSQTNPAGPLDGDSKVLRGGSYGHNEASIRTAIRGINAPSGRSGIVGFRCVGISPRQ